MNDDLIKRSDAIESLGEEPYVWTDDDFCSDGERIDNEIPKKSDRTN